MVSIEPIQIFLRSALRRTQKNSAPLLRRQSPEGDGAHCDVPASPVSGAHTGTCNTALSQPGDASSVRGRTLAEAPGSGNENFVSGYRTFGGCYTIAKKNMSPLPSPYITDKRFIQTASWRRQSMRASLIEPHWVTALSHPAVQVSEQRKTREAFCASVS